MLGSQAYSFSISKFLSCLSTARRQSNTTYNIIKLHQTKTTTVNKITQNHKLGQLNRCPGERVHNGEAATKKALPLVSANRASVTRGTQRKASSAENCAQVRKYWCRQSFRHPVPKLYRTLLVKISTLNWTVQIIGGQCNCCNYGSHEIKAAYVLN